jgi:DNA polymerase III subunit delta
VAQPQPLEPVYLLTGMDLPKIALALRRLRARFEAGSVELLTAESTSGADAVAAANSLGLFGGGERLVVVEEIDRWKQADADAVAAYLQSPTSGSVLALVGNPAKLAGLAEECSRAGETLRYDVPIRKQRGRETQDFPAWVRGQLQRGGVQFEHDCADRLVEIVGTDTFALQSEIDKLATWAAGQHVTVGDVEALTVPTAETSATTLMNAWGSRDESTALRTCEAELRGEPEPFWLAGRLATYVGRVRAVQGLLDEGLGVQEIGKRLGLRFPPRREAAVSAGFTGDELEAAVVRLAELDLALKGGSRLDPVLELERALLDVTGAGEPARSD